MKYVILKVDTTGLNIDSSDIVRVSLLAVDGASKTKRVFLVNPGLPIPIEASKISGIYDEDIKNAPSFEEIKGELLSIISNTPIVGHNLDFDLGFISKHMILENKSMSLMKLARVTGYSGPLTFKVLRKNYNVPEDFDTLDATNFIFQAMVQKINKRKR